MNRVEAVCAGEVTIDLIQVDEASAGVPVLEAHVGGAPLNVAAGLARQGVDAAIWSVIGRDATGELILRQLEEGPVRLDWLSTHPYHRTRIAYIDVDPETGQRRTRVLPGPTADHYLEPDRLPDLGSSCRLFYVSGAALLGDLTQTVVKSAIKRLRRRDDVIIALDPNIRIGRSERASVIRSLMHEIAREADVLQYDRERAEEYWDADTPPFPDISLVIETRSGGGAVLRTPSASVHVDAVPAALVDSTGAGDAFLSTVLARINGIPRHELRDVGSELLAEWGRAGAEAAARIVGIRGGGASLRTLPEA